MKRSDALVGLQRRSLVTQNLEGKLLAKELVLELCKAGKLRQAQDPERVMRFIASTERVDRMGDIIRQEWDLKSYQSNAVILWDHDQGKNIGRSLGEEIITEGEDFERVGRHLAIYVEFMPESIDPFAEKVFQMYKGGWLKGGSVGYVPVEIDEVLDEEQRKSLGLGPVGVVFNKSELAEFSLCTVPANQEALATEMKGAPAEVIKVIEELTTKSDGWEITVKKAPVKEKAPVKRKTATLEDIASEIDDYVTSLEDDEASERTITFLERLAEKVRSGDATADELRALEDRYDLQGQGEEWADLYEEAQGEKKAPVKRKALDEGNPCWVEITFEDADGDFDPDVAFDDLNTMLSQYGGEPAAEMGNDDTFYADFESQDDAEGFLAAADSKYGENIYVNVFDKATEENLRWKRGSGLKKKSDEPVEETPPENTEDGDDVVPQLFEQLKGMLSDKPEALAVLEDLAAALELETDEPSEARPMLGASAKKPLRTKFSRDDIEAALEEVVSSAAEEDSTTVESLVDAVSNEEWDTVLSLLEKLGASSSKLYDLANQASEEAMSTASARKPLRTKALSLDEVVSLIEGTEDLSSDDKQRLISALENDELDEAGGIWEDNRNDGEEWSDEVLEYLNTYAKSLKPKSSPYDLILRDLREANEAVSRATRAGEGSKTAPARPAALRSAQRRRR